MTETVKVTKTVGLLINAWKGWAENCKSQYRNSNPEKSADYFLNKKVIYISRL